ncbi:MarR family winged helix-turn-helix transcriptional regulator [Neobacillus sp. LXY-1]|uniref:MarR family winged helix-turn-helix transcriptional regulator n=1 Tax=Neobacillus sp. LXY-1 TaxID=3379133 RepID=UPI003EE02594
MIQLNNELLDSFAEINRAIYRLIKKDADRAGITVVQLKALYFISLHQEVGLGELADKLKLTNSTVSGVIDRLVQQELVERLVPPENRRSVSIKLTDKGEAILKELFSNHSILVNRIKQVMDLPKEEINHLLRLHKLILSVLITEEEK